MLKPLKNKLLPSEDNLLLNDIGFDTLSETVEDYESFISIISHDFSASIRHIKEFSSLLKSSITTLEDDQGLYFSYIENSLVRLDKMQSALMTLNDIQNKTHKVSNVDMQDMLQRVVKQLDFTNYKTEVEITCEPLPTIKAVPELMETLLFHLLDNACRYSPDNGKQKLFLRNFEKDEQIIFEVRDNGIGIDNEFCKNVFHIFRRLHAQGDFGDGIGAGLTIAKKIVEAHDGQIWIKSKLDHGTSVFFTTASSS